ncbi:MAG: HAMP domain-containing histidine kinase [Deltaproteobacteria bacterium]|nr:HAMP domain-containing histidine kinase [Deltaproteobacteria bacterium]
MPATQPTASLLLGFPADPLVLVCDRDAAARRELETLCARMKVRTVALESAGQLLQQVKVEAPDLAVIATDHGEVDGIEVCTQLKASAATNLIAVLLVGRGNETDDRRTAFAAGTDGWFPRPVQAEEFLARCWSLLRTRGLVHTLEERRRTYRLRQEFSRFLVHDLRGPLTGALLGIDLARMKLQDGDSRDEVATSLDDIAFGLKRLTDMVQDLLDVDRIDRGKFKVQRDRFSLAALLADVKRTFQAPSRERAAPLWLEGPTDVELDADRDLVERVLGNLVFNALHHGPQGQPVILDVAVEAKLVRIAVTNRGEPLPTADRQRIFEPFVRLSEKFRTAGAGLGLAFCKVAVEAHGGTIFVEDYAGGGTSFVFTIPTEGLRPPAPPTKPAGSPPSPAGSGRGGPSRGAGRRRLAPAGAPRRPPRGVAAVRRRRRGRQRPCRSRRCPGGRPPSGRTAAAPR